VTLSNQFRRPPAHVVVRIPWFFEVQSAEAAGHAIQINDGQLFLPPDTREVRIRGRIKPGTPGMSYEQTVENYKKEYKTCYEEFLRTGMISCK
jgi:hypothetical protein